MYHSQGNRWRSWPGSVKPEAAEEISVTPGVKGTTNNQLPLSHPAMLTSPHHETFSVSRYISQFPSGSSSHSSQSTQSSRYTITTPDSNYPTQTMLIHAVSFCPLTVGEHLYGAEAETQTDVMMPVH